MVEGREKQPWMTYEHVMNTLLTRYEQSMNTLLTLPIFDKTKTREDKEGDKKDIKDIKINEDKWGHHGSKN